MIKNLLSIVALFTLVSCGTARTIVTDPIEFSDHVSGINIKRSKKSSADSNQEHLARFETKLREALFKSGKYKEGGNLTLSYRFVQFSEGSRFARWFTGGIGNAGEGSLVVEVEYIINGKVIGKIQADGRIGSGVFGGSVDNAIEKAATEVANYTLSQ